MAKPETPSRPEPAPTPTPAETAEKPPREIGGPPGPEPTRHGDWEFNGRCSDF